MVAEAAQEAELERIAEVKEEEREGVLANISMSSKTSQESAMESAGETHRIQAVQQCVSILMHQNILELPGSQNFRPKFCPHQNIFCENISTKTFQHC